MRHRASISIMEKMPDLTPSHLNLAPPSPPSSPPPHGLGTAHYPPKEPLVTQDLSTTTARQTIQTLLQGYSSLSVASLLIPLSQDFVHRVLPASLGMPPRDKTSFAGHAAGIFSIFETFQMIPDEMYFDEDSKTVTIHARMEGVWKSEPGMTSASTAKKGKRGQGELEGDAGKWNNECVMIVRLTRDGTQVLEITEFVDSAKAMEMRARHAPKNFDVPGRWAVKWVGGALGRLGVRLRIFSDSPFATALRWTLRGSLLVTGMWVAVDSVWWARKVLMRAGWVY